MAQFLRSGCVKNRAVRNFATKVISAFTTDCNPGGTFSNLVGTKFDFILDDAHGTFPFVLQLKNFDK